MTIWVDAQLSPKIAVWIRGNFPVQARSLKKLGLRNAEDEVIFAAARRANAVILTKDIDFVHLLEEQGSPPKVLWLTCGNTSNANLQQILQQHLAAALELLSNGENLVEISAP